MEFLECEDNEFLLNFYTRNHFKPFDIRTTVPVHNGDDSISETKKKKLTSLYRPADSRLFFLAKVVSFGMERPFVQRNTKNQKLIAGNGLSLAVLDYIMDSKVPRPCQHFVGREEELEELHTMLEENSKVFLYGIAEIGKSEVDFTDDLLEDGKEERFRKHNRFLRSLKDDTLLIIDNFNATATQDSFLPVMLKYRCRILFTTRSKLDGHCMLQLKEIRETSALFLLVFAFYTESEERRVLVEEIIETVHRHTFAVELATKLLENGVLHPMIQFIVLAGVIFLQKRLVHSAPPPDGAAFLRQLQIRDVVVSHHRIADTVVMDFLW